LYLGLTGGIASGKSTVANMFAQLGAYTIDADEISREVMKPGQKAYSDVVSVFGKEILRQDGTIDREKLKKIVFSDNSMRKKLEEIVHPEILAYEKRIVGSIKGNDDKAIIITHAALIIEKKTYKRFDGVIVVYAELDQQIQRLMARDNISVEYAKKIISSQMSINEKVKYANFIVDNSKSLEDTYKDVKRIFNALEIYRYCIKQLKKQQLVVD